MTRWTRLAGAFALVAGLTAASVAPAQTQNDGARAAVAPAQPAAAAPQPVSLPALSAAPPIKPWDPNADQPVYSVPPPPDGSSGIYLPAVVGGYAKSVAGCVLVGCDDGPQVGGAPGPSSSSSDAPQPQPPASPRPSDPH
jgi:hypothetical protein